MPLLRPIFLLAALCAVFPTISVASRNYTYSNILPRDFSTFEDRPPNCPPCFNCNLEAFGCQQFGHCNKANGKCDCPAGFGGEDCSAPLCGSPPLGKDRPPRRSDQHDCDCTEGWDGINCNVCRTNEACNALMPEKEGGICFTGGVVQRQNHQMCDVTNRKIMDQLDPKKPQATFSCNAEEEECAFQFWIDQVESFYCELDKCSWNFEVQDKRNISTYACENIKCKCVPGRMLCGEAGSIDISDFLEQSIKGPASFKSISTDGGSSQDGSTFSEPAMDDLISNIFGDTSILLSCYSGECLYQTEVPGYEKPVKVINTPLIAGVIAGCSLLVVIIILVFWYMSRRSPQGLYGPLHLGEADEDEIAKLMSDHKPAALHFQNVSYSINRKQLLSGIHGAVNPGELMAIMGASGAGKTTFLDILARKNKKGQALGEFYVNGEKMNNDDFKSATGFVDQDDTMLSTLTVHETIVDSAMLRLPKDMTIAAKLQRVEDVEKQLGIYHIRDQIVGSEEAGNRGISGGERRRVGIACELVTSPSILFLDEPTSGLDSYNAYNVVECLVNLVKTYNRTVIFTIHQPRSNIVALFDQLVLLARGRMVYSGPFSACQSYFDSIGYHCPPGFNIADYLVDLTMHASIARSAMDEILEAQAQQAGLQTRSSSVMAVKSIMSTVSTAASNAATSIIDHPRRPGGIRRSTSVRQQQERQLFTRKQNERQERRGSETPATLRSEEEHGLLDNQREASQAWLRLSKQTNVPSQFLDDEHSSPRDAHVTGTDLDDLITSYADSQVASSIRDFIQETMTSANSSNGQGHSNGNRPNGTSAHGGRMQTFRKVGILGQIRILSVRTWRNLYRNPFLMLTHYAISILLAVLLGFLFYGLTDDIAGFQNRLGVFFFVLALFGFSTLTSITVFGTERLLFVRERAKGYYTPLSYFIAKVLFDVVPLRLLPPIIFGGILYPMTGLVPSWPQFLIFILFLVLFNLAATTIFLFIGVIFRDNGLANLVGILVMLFSLLFSGFLLNQASIPQILLWLQAISVCHYAFEGIIVNEVKYLSLVDHKYGLDIEVPGSAILSSFGFNVQALWRDVIGLGVFSGIFLVVAYLSIRFVLIERR